MKPKSLHFYIRRYLLVLAITPIIVLGVWMIANVSTHYRKDQDFLIDQTIKVIAQRIDGFNATNEKLLTLFVTDPLVVGALGKSDSEGSEGLDGSEGPTKLPLNSLIARFDKTSGAGYSMALGLENGAMFSANAKDLPKDYDPRVRPWYRDAVNASGLITLSDPYPDAIDPTKYTITYAVRVSNPESGELIGAAGLDVNLETLVAFEAENVLPQGSFFQITDRNNKVLTPYVRPKNFQENNYFKHSFYHPRNRWNISAYLPKSQLIKAQTSVFATIASVLLCFVFIAFAIIHRIDKKLMGPLDYLVLALDSVHFDQGDWGDIAQIESPSRGRENTADRQRKTTEEPLEVWQLRTALNTMLARIDLQRSMLLDNQKKLSNQYMEIEALYEETTAMNASLNDMLDSLNDSWVQTIRVLSNAIEANDEYTKGHCDRVTDFALDIGRALELNDHTTKQLEFAALLHDVGKISVPSNILNKASALLAEERTLIERHPVAGHHIVEGVAFLSEAAIIIRHHHERYDGSGYPDGLKGDKIPLLASIIAVADAYDAMTSERAYRKQPLTKDEAMSELKRNKGTQFDPTIVDIFENL